MSTIDTIKADFSIRFPIALVDALFDSFNEIREQFYLGKHEPSELNGGKFVEACSRLIQNEFSGTHTPIGTSIRDMTALLRSFETLPSTHHDSFRIHIPRLLLTIYTTRNRRGVGHLGGDVNPNLSDATMIVTAANWIIAELYRIVYSSTIDIAQRITDDLVRRKLVIVHSVDNIRRVLLPSLPARDQALLLLANEYPTTLTIENLITSIEYANRSNFKKIIMKLHKECNLHCNASEICTILPPGLKYVEDNYTSWVSKLNKRS